MGKIYNIPEESKKFICPTCGLKTHNPYILKTHISRKHLKISSKVDSKIDNKVDITDDTRKAEVNDKPNITETNKNASIVNSPEISVRDKETKPKPQKQGGVKMALEKMVKKLSIPVKIHRNWLINKENIFDSRYKYSSDNQRIFKFCYQPEAKELLFDVSPTHHNILILAYGKKKFDDYVRGICFWNKKTIYLRMHENKDWLKLTKKMLRENGVPKNIRIVWGERAAKELAEDLKGL